MNPHHLSSLQPLLLPPALPPPKDLPLSVPAPLQPPVRQRSHVPIYTTTHFLRPQRFNCRLNRGFSGSTTAAPNTAVREKGPSPSRELALQIVVPGGQGRSVVAIGDSSVPQAAGSRSDVPAPSTAAWSPGLKVTFRGPGVMMGSRAVLPPRVLKLRALHSPHPKFSLLPKRGPSGLLSTQGPGGAWNRSLCLALCPPAGLLRAASSAGCSTDKGRSLLAPVLFSLFRKHFSWVCHSHCPCQSSRGMQTPEAQALCPPGT